MSILNSVIKLFVGNKQQKDLKILQPIVEKVQAFESALAGLPNDKLRNKTLEFKKKSHLQQSHLPIRLNLSSKKLQQRILNDRRIFL